MGVLHSVLRRHSVFTIPKSFVPLHSAPPIGILWPQDLLDELHTAYAAFETERQAGRIPPLDDLRRLKTLLILRPLAIDESFRETQIRRVQRQIEFRMALLRIEKAILEGDQRGLGTQEMEAAVKLMEKVLNHKGKKPLRHIGRVNMKARV